MVNFLPLVIYAIILPMSSSINKKKSSHYHHGDLRVGLIQAARQSLRETGVNALSLRAVAASLGVSHAAAYYHFKNKNDLVVAIAVTAFAELEVSQRSIFERTYEDPVTRLSALAEGYIAFALAHPDEFRLMFSPQLRRDDELTDVEKAGREGYQLLLDAVEAVKKENLLSTGDVEQAAIALWSTIHGLASLMLDGPLYRNAKSKEGRNTLTRIAITSILYGVLSG